MSAEQWYGCKCSGLLTGTQISMHMNAHRGYANIITESAPNDDSGRKPLAAWGNQTSVHSTLDPMLTQLSCIPALNPHLQPLHFVHVVVNHFHTVLLSALKQTHCTNVACDSKWVTVAFYKTYWILTALFGCWMAGVTWNCCHLGTSSVYTINHAPVYNVGFSCNMPPAFFAE